MNYKIKTILIATVFASLFFNMNVQAQNKNELLHINSNGVILTEKEYQFVNKFYGLRFFDNMTQEDYDWISDLNINSNEVEVVSLEGYEIGDNVPYSSSYSTKSKRISLAKSCSTVCTIITNLTWLTDPKVRSYDVIGARLYNTKLANETITTKLTSSSGTISSSNNKFLTNGFGTAIKLPEGSSNIIIQQKFYTKSGGTIYASYQHATSNISLETSLKFTINSTGLGSVFTFYGDAVGKYDGMAGVSISL